MLLKGGACTIGLHKTGQQYQPLSGSNTPSERNTKIVFETDGDLAERRETLLKENVKLRELKTFDNYGYLLCDKVDNLQYGMHLWKQLVTDKVSNDSLYVSQ